MLTMSEQHYIKHLRNNKSYCVNKIAKTMDLNWRTAKSFADTEQLPNEKTKVKDGMMYKEKWGEIVSDWLEEDRKMKKKDRRTNKGVLIQLKDLGFPGSYRILCHFIQDIRGV